MKLFCSSPSLSMVAIMIVRYYSLNRSVLEMFRFKRFLMLLLHQMFISKSQSIKFRFSIFVFKLFLKDGLYYVYQMKDSKSLGSLVKFDFNFKY